MSGLIYWQKNEDTLSVQSISWLRKYFTKKEQSKEKG
jgi:hypothetical protein